MKKDRDFSLLIRAKTMKNDEKQKIFKEIFNKYRRQKLIASKFQSIKNPDDEWK